MEFLDIRPCHLSTEFQHREQREGQTGVILKSFKTLQLNAIYSSFLEVSLVCCKNIIFFELRKNWSGLFQR